MTNTVPVPQGATLGYGDESQPQGQGQPGQAPNGLKTVPVPQGATLGYGDESQTQGVQTQPNPEPTTEMPMATGFEGSTEEMPQVPQSSVKEGLYGATVGAAKGVGSTVATASELLSKIPGMDKIIPKEGVTALRGITTPENASEKIGYIAENLGEFFAGDEVLKGLSIAEKLGLAERVAQYAKTSPRVAAIINHGMTAARQGLVAGAQTTAHTGDIGEGVKTGLTAGAIGAGTGAAIEGAGAAKAALKPILSTKPLQEPFQRGITDIVKNAVEDARPAPAPEPDYVYRARDVGEQGVPKAHPQSHGQATPDLKTVDQYAGPGGRGEAAGEPKPQEVVRINRNRLKSEDYTEIPSKTDQAAQTNFNRPLSEDEVEKWGSDERRAEAAEQAKKAAEPVVPPTKSMRRVAEQAGDQVEGMAKSDYQLLDKESGGRIQRFRDKLEANRRKLLNLTDSEEDKATEASILKNQKATEDEMQDEFESLRKKGVPPELLDRADANFRKSQALYDLDNALKKSTVGAHPDFSAPAILEEHPETVDPKKFFNRINALHDSGRLTDALGDDGAEKLFDHALKHFGDYQKVIRNQKIAQYASGAGVLSSLGYGGYHTVKGVLGALK